MRSMLKVLSLLALIGYILLNIYVTGGPSRSVKVSPVQPAIQATAQPGDTGSIHHTKTRSVP